MRELTEEELKLAPDWAYFYGIFNGEVVFMSRGRDDNGDYTFYHKEHGIYKGREPIYMLCDKVIKQKPFDIAKHEWSDVAKDCHILFNAPSWAGGDLQICIADPNGNYADDVLIREHAIAIARHFGLTAEDLK